LLHQNQQALGAAFEEGEDEFGGAEEDFPEALEGGLGFEIILPIKRPGDAKLEECGIHGDIIETQARTLLLQAAKGTPRMLNAVLQKAMEHAAGEQRRKLSLADMQASVNAVPWAALGQR